MHTLTITSLQKMRTDASSFFALCKPRVSAMIVFTAIIGMLLAVNGPIDLA